MLECQKHGIKEAILSCEKSNIASSKTMKHLGGKLDREVFDEKRNCMIEFYRINVDYSVAMYKKEFEKYIVQ